MLGGPWDCLTSRILRGKIGRQLKNNEDQDLNTVRNLANSILGRLTSQTVLGLFEEAQRRSYKMHSEAVKMKATVLKNAHYFKA